MTTPTTKATQPAVMTIAEICEVLQIAPSTVSDMCRGVLAPYVVRVGETGRGLRVKRAEFWRWYESQGKDGN